MNGKRRFLSVILIFSLLLSCLTGCGQGTGQTETSRTTGAAGTDSSTKDTGSPDTTSPGQDTDPSGQGSGPAAGNNDDPASVLPAGADYILGSDLAAGIDFGEITVVYGTEHQTILHFEDLEAELPNSFFASADGSGDSGNNGSGEVEYLINDMYTTLNYWWGTLYAEMEGMTDEQKAEHLLSYGSEMLTCQIEGKMTSDALDKGLAVISMYPHPVLLNNYGTMLMYAEKYDLALEIFEIVYDQTGDLAIVLTNIASCYYEQGDIKNAKKCAEEALTEQQGFGPALQLLTSIALEEGDALKALEYLFRSAETYWNSVSANQFLEAQQFLAQELARTGIHPFEEYPHLYDLLVTALKAGAAKEVTGKTAKLSYVAVGNLEAAEEYLVETSQSVHDKYYDTIIDTIPDKYDDKLLPYQSTMMEPDMLAATFQMEGWDQNMDLSAAPQLFCYYLLDDYYEYRLSKRVSISNTPTDMAGNYLNPYTPLYTKDDQLDAIDEVWEEAADARYTEFFNDQIEHGQKWEAIWDAHDKSQRHIDGADQIYYKCNDCYRLEAQERVEWLTIGYEYELDCRDMRLNYLRQMYSVDESYWGAHIKPAVEEYYTEMTRLLQYISDETIQNYCAACVEAEVYYYGTVVPFSWAADRANGLELARYMLDHYIEELGYADQRLEKERHILEIEIKEMGIKPYKEGDWQPSHELDLGVTELLFQKNEKGEDLIGLKGLITGDSYFFNLNTFEGSVISSYNGNAAVPLTQIKDGLTGEYDQFYKNMPYFVRKFADSVGATPDNMDKFAKNFDEFMRGPLDYMGKQIAGKAKDKAASYLPATYKDNTKVYSEIHDPSGRRLFQKTIRTSSLQGEVNLGVDDTRMRIGFGFTKTVTRMGCAVKTQRQMQFKFKNLKLTYTK